MQQNCVGVGTLPCLQPSFDFTSSSSLLLLQDDPYGFSSPDTVGPYTCNGSSSAGAAIISSPPAGAGTAGTTAGDSRARRGGEETRKKQRRLASNRESARRSRVRKQRRLGELSSRVAELRDAKRRLLVELNRAIASHARVARENAELREEARDLRKRLDDENHMHGGAGSGVEADEGRARAQQAEQRPEKMA